MTPSSRITSVSSFDRPVEASAVLTPVHEPLRERWFEIQIRSILEHAWAEIEHQIVYKSGVAYPKAVLRRFAALAGSLELLDNEFLALREQRSDLIESYRLRYQRNEDHQKPFDAARLLGFLEASRAEGRSWRQAAAAGAQFAEGLDVSCVDALKAVRLGTPASLRVLFRSSPFRYAVRSFAASQGIAPAEMSHLAIVVLAVAIANARMVQRHFPEVVYDPAIAEMVLRRITRSAKKRVSRMSGSAGAGHRFHAGADGHSAAARSWLS